MPAKRQMGTGSLRSETVTCTLSQMDGLPAPDPPPRPSTHGEVLSPGKRPEVVVNRRTGSWVLRGWVAPDLDDSPQRLQVPYPPQVWGRRLRRTSRVSTVSDTGLDGRRLTSGPVKEGGPTNAHFVLPHVKGGPFQDPHEPPPSPPTRASRSIPLPGCPRGRLQGGPDTTEGWTPSGSGAPVRAAAG